MSATNTSAEFELSQPISVLLARATKQVHDQVASSAGAAALGSGNLSREEYVKYLIYLWHIYSTLEAALDKHASHPSLAPTYNPTILGRASALSSDISAFLQTPSWQTHPLNLALQPLPQPLLAYTNRIQNLSDSEDPTALLAHSYTRYLGDLSGGQHIKRVVVKTYDVDNDAASFYDFAKQGGKAGEMANQGDVIKLKAAFKKGMDEGIRSEEHKEAVLRETRLAFHYNDELLKLLRPSVPAVPAKVPVTPTEEPKEDVLAPIKAILNNPTNLYVGISLAIALTVLIPVASPNAKTTREAIGGALSWLVPGRPVLA